MELDYLANLCMFYVGMEVGTGVNAQLCGYASIEDQFP